MRCGHEAETGMQCPAHHACSAKCANAQGGDLHDALHLGEERIEWKAGGCRLAAQIALGLSKLHLRKVWPR